MAEYEGYFCLVLQPNEVKFIVDGWPDDIWLILVNGRHGRKWNVGHSEEEVLGCNDGLPVWPLIDGLPIRNVRFEDEMSLLYEWATQENILEAVQARIAPRPVVEEKTIDDIIW